MSFRCKTYFLQNDGGLQYKFSVNRYSLVDEDDQVARNSHKSTSVTLILLHALGLHKETWEPFLEDIQSLQSINPSFGALGCATEAWAIDCVSHGDSAILNEEKLQTDEGLVNTREFARSAITLLESSCFASPTKRKLVLVGHSGGASAAILVMDVLRWRRINPLESLVLIEPPILATPLSTLKDRTEHWITSANTLAKFTERRRDRWANADDAFAWFSSRPSYRSWDKRVLSRYVKHSLRPLPTVFYPHHTQGSGLTLKTHRVLESEAFVNPEETAPAGSVLEGLQMQIPIHVIFGGSSEFKPNDEEMRHLTSRRGRNSFYASVTDIPGANHLLVQEAPAAVAQSLLDIVRHQVSFPVVSQELETGISFGNRRPQRSDPELRSLL